MQKQTTYQHYNKMVWHQFKKHRPAYFALYVLLFLICIALLAPVIANEKPLYAKYGDTTVFPAFSHKKNYTLTNENGDTLQINSQYADWKQLPFDKVIWAPIPYSPGVKDYANSNFKSPSGQQFFKSPDGKLIEMPARFRHWLGTNNLGEDVLSGLIHGTRISLSIGIIAMGIATIVGLLLGMIAGYFGDNVLQTSRGRFWTTIIGFFFAWYYAFHMRTYILEDALQHSGIITALQFLISLCIFAIIVFLFSFMGKFIGKLPFAKKIIHVPADNIVSRLIEIIHSLPIFILIITIAAIAKPSLVNVMIIIGLTSWTGIARFTRAEMLRIRNLEFMQAAQSLGYSRRRMLLKHALPNGIAPALVAIAFGIASAILVESSLSFLGVGVPPESVTWGSLVNEGRSNFNAWWLVVFPGLAIFITVTAYNLIGEGLRDAFDPKLKN